MTRFVSLERDDSFSKRDMTLEKGLMGLGHAVLGNFI